MTEVIPTCIAEAFALMCLTEEMAEFTLDREGVRVTLPLRSMNRPAVSWDHNFRPRESRKIQKQRMVEATKSSSWKNFRDRFHNRPFNEVDTTRAGLVANASPSLCKVSFSNMSPEITIQGVAQHTVILNCADWSGVLSTPEHGMVQADNSFAAVTYEAAVGVSQGALIRFLEEDEDE